MRTREEVLAAPPTFDIIVWLPCQDCEGRRVVWIKDKIKPCKCHFGGRWERHASYGALPAQLDALFPTDAEDLMTIFPALSPEDVSMMLLHYTYRRLTRSIEIDSTEWSKAWRYLRRHMPMTIEGTKSAGPVPQGKEHFPAPPPDPTPLHKRPTLYGQKRGTSLPITGPRGVHTYHLLYRPNTIERMDVRFTTLPRIARDVVLAILEMKKPYRDLPDGSMKTATFSRAELYSALATFGYFVNGMDGWRAWCRSRATLLRLGFVAEEYPPVLHKSGKTGIRPYVDLKQHRARRKAA